MLRRFTGVGRVLAAGAMAGLAMVSASAQQFPQGPCSGVLCSTIGGQQAPQKSLFPQGECSGVLCPTIGGAQAPKYAEPPPACGGGLLCDMNPYAMGVPMTAAEAQRQQAARAAQEAAMSGPGAPAAPSKKTSTVKKKVARRTTAKPDTAAR